MNINNIKDIRPGRQLPKKLLAIFVSILIITGSFILLNNTGKAARDTVNVVKIKHKEGIPAKTPITEEDLEIYPLISREFGEDMVTDINEAVGNYSLYYLRGKTILYKDEFSAEKPLKNEWLYQLDKESEVLTIPYSFLECGGDILTPGDTVRIRVAYDDTEAARDPSRGDSFSSGYGNEKITRKADTLFESISVKDLLNSKGHSIYEVYKEVLKLSEAQKQEVMKSSDFLDNILPRSLVLEGTAGQVEKYAKYKSKKDISFTITILSRQGNTSIMDQLPTVAKEIESWISEKK